MNIAEELAAAQAREKVLRAALEDVSTIMRGHGYLHFAKQAEKALAMPVGDTALKAALAAERERCAEVCDTVGVSLDTREMSRGAFAVANAIRALGDQ